MAYYIALDLDDVLANLREPLMAMLNRRTGRVVHWSEWRQYELCGVYGASVEEIQRWVIEDEVLEAAGVEPHAREAVEAARQAGYRVAVVTARGWHPRGEELTGSWLAGNGLAVDEVHLVPAFGDKAGVLRALGRVRHFIDDHVGHLYPARALPEVEETHLLDRPWNRSDETLRRIYGLDELVRLCEHEG